MSDEKMDAVSAWGDIARRLKTEVEKLRSDLLEREAQAAGVRRAIAAVRGDLDGWMGQELDAALAPDAGRAFLERSNQAEQLLADAAEKLDLEGLEDAAAEIRAFLAPDAAKEPTR